jgi:hypothetical protein
MSKQSKVKIIMTVDINSSEIRETLRRCDDYDGSGSPQRFRRSPVVNTAPALCAENEPH